MHQLSNQEIGWRVPRLALVAGFILLVASPLAWAQDLTDNQEEVRQWLAKQFSDALDVAVEVGESGVDYLVYVPRNLPQTYRTSRATSALQRDTTLGPASVLVFNEDKNRLLLAVRRTGTGLVVTGSAALAPRSAIPHGVTGLTNDTTTSQTPEATAPVTFTSDPPNAKLEVEGMAVGRTPVTVPLPIGEAISYLIEADEPYADYRLYEIFGGRVTVPAEGTAISIWIERTTAEQQASQRAAAHRAELEAQREAELEAERIYYRVETACPQGASVTFSNVHGDTTQHASVRSGWYYGFIPRAGQFLYVSAQNQCSSGYVTVRITHDGQALRENTSTGGHTIASISGTW